MPSRAARLAAPAAVAGVTGLGCAAVWFANPTAGGPTLCPFKAVTGMDCPGCGGLRMVYSMMHGDVAAALHYNAVALVALGFLVVCYAGWVRHLWAGMPWNPQWLRRRVPTITVVVFMAWFVVRIIPVAPFTGLHV